MSRHIDPLRSDGRTPPPARSGDQLDELLVRLLRQETSHPLPLKKLTLEVARQVESRRAGRVEAVLAAMADRGEVLDLGGGAYFLAENMDTMQRRICEVMQAYHVSYPYEPQMPTGEVKARYSKGKTRNARRNVDPALFERAMARLRERGLVIDGPEGVRLATFTPTAADQAAQQRFEQALLGQMHELRYHRLDLDDLAVRLDAEPRKVRSVFVRLLKEGVIVQYGELRYMPAADLASLQADLKAAFVASPRLSTATIKEVLGAPRNALIALLEFLDAAGFTRRNGDERMLGAVPPT